MSLTLLVYSRNTGSSLRIRCLENSWYYILLFHISRINLNVSQIPYYLFRYFVNFPCIVRLLDILQHIHACTSMYLWLQCFPLTHQSSIPPTKEGLYRCIQFLESHEFSWVLHVTMKSEDAGLHLHCKTLRKWSKEELRKDIAYTGKDDIYLGSWQRHGTIYLQARYGLQFALWEVIVSISSPPSVHRLKSRAG